MCMVFDAHLGLSRQPLEQPALIVLARRQVWPVLPVDGELEQTRVGVRCAWHRAHDEVIAPGTHWVDAAVRVHVELDILDGRPG